MINRQGPEETENLTLVDLDMLLSGLFKLQGVLESSAHEPDLGNRPDVLDELEQSDRTFEKILIMTREKLREQRVSGVDRLTADYYSMIAFVGVKLTEFNELPEMKFGWTRKSTAQIRKDWIEMGLIDG